MSRKAIFSIILFSACLFFALPKVQADSHAGRLYSLLQDSISTKIDSTKIDSTKPPASGQINSKRVSKLDKMGLLNNNLDSTVRDTSTIDSVPQKIKKKSEFEYPVEVSAADSIVITADGQAFLYREGKMVYKEATQKEVMADFIYVNMDSNAFRAIGVPDTTGKMIGEPIFMDGGQEYRAKEINYNFKTEKGYIRGATTQEGEGYIIADKTKKLTDGCMNMKDGKYTSCGNTQHPHFYMRLTKARVKPDGYVAAGPAYMIVEDVPLPLAVPFGFFPFTSRYSSGIIMPSYGDEMEAGFFLKNGGYYFAINDYFDLALTGDIYTKGSWGLQLSSNYRKRYKFDGSVNIQYNNIVRGEKDLPGYNVNKDFRIDWTHRQDPKASAFSTFSASVNFFTNGYNKNSIDYNYNPALQSQAETSSSINFTQRVPNAPISFSVNASVRQSVRDSSINLTLPTFRMDLSTIYPFKRKNRIGKERFYEKFSFSYSMEFSNSFNGKENRVLKSNFAKEWQNGIMHSPQISMPLTVLKYLNITPRFTYKERWYFKKINQSWNDAEQIVEYDTISGFYRAYDFSTGVSLSTTLYGFYSPIKKIKDALGIGDIRHVFKPSINFSYTPDFSEPKWKMYEAYTQTILNPSTGETEIREVVYSPFAAGKYGVPGRGKNGRLNVTLDNNLEMKVKDKLASDTTNTIVYKKISLIDNFNLSGGYNFIADSLRMEDIRASIRLKITNNYSITLATTFEPYMYGLDKNGNPVKINQYRWKNGKAPWFTGTAANFAYTINNSTFKKKDKKRGEQNNQYDPNNPDPNNPTQDFNLDPSQHQNDSTILENRNIEDDAEGYQKPNVQWSLAFNIGVGWGKTTEFDFEKMEYKRDFREGVLGLSGYVNPTSNWQIGYSASLILLKKVALTSMSFNLTRHLHCWRLTASVTPVGYYKSFMVTIGANAAMLRDLKYDKRKRDNITVW